MLFEDTVEGGFIVEADRKSNVEHCLFGFTFKQLLGVINPVLVYKIIETFLGTLIYDLRKLIG